MSRQRDAQGHEGCGTQHPAGGSGIIGRSRSAPCRPSIAHRGLDGSGVRSHVNGHGECQPEGRSPQDGHPVGVKVSVRVDAERITENSSQLGRRPILGGGGGELDGKYGSEV